MSSVHDQIVTNQNNNTITKAEQDRRTGAKQSSSSVNSQDFLQLMTMQLQYQDPMNPMDNSEMLAQEAQFATLEQMENLSSSFTKFSNVYQANSFLGQTVEVTVEGKTATGKVDFVDYSDKNGASVNIGGKSYPLEAVTKIYPAESTIKIGDEEVDTTSFFASAIDTIAGNLGYLAQKAYEYFDGDKEVVNPLESGNKTKNNNITTNNKLRQ